MRVGVLAKKIGMSRIYAIDNSAVPITLLKLENCTVSEVVENNSNSSTVIVTASEADPNKTNKPQRDRLQKLNIAPGRISRSFKVSKKATPEVGHKLDANHFALGQYVDVSATSKGKGFAGAMKRHNFKGLEATHGVSISHRSHGSTGQCQDPGKVFKGKKMAGHLGSVRKTIQNLEIMYCSIEDNIIGVCGGVPGSNGSIIEIKDAMKQPRSPEAPYPFYVPKTNTHDNEATSS